MNLVALLAAVFNVIIAAMFVFSGGHRGPWYVALLILCVVLLVLLVTPYVSR